jgi:hypothetical protein
MTIDGSQLRPLGTDRRGRQWLSGPMGEYEERPRKLTESDVLPNAALVEEKVDGVRSFRVFSVHEPGTFARLQAAPVPGPKPPAPPRPVDALLFSDLAGSRSDRIVAPPSRDTLAPTSARGGLIAGRPAVRGPEALLGRLAERGTVVTLSADRAGLVVTAPGGRPAPGTAQLVALAHPILLGHLRGEPLMCSVTAHKSPTPATTIAVGGSAWCGECTPPVTHTDCGGHGRAVLSPRDAIPRAVDSLYPQTTTTAGDRWRSAQWAGR